MNQVDYLKPNVRRVRLSEWAKGQGISRITAYRMLRTGLLPVPCERSPTGRWYVLLQEERQGRTAVYARAAPGPSQVEVINRQVADLCDWAAQNRRKIFTVVREIAEPFVSPMPRLCMLLADSQVTDIIVTHPMVLGRGQFQLISAIMQSQGRSVIPIQNDLRGWDGRSEIQAGLTKLCTLLHGDERGPKVAEKAIRGL